ncbi:pyroglutamyl-peptidase I [Endozoicomonas sp. Mp262]|uniref:pyroglutamyl-peptidase I n=1 Tax=Endozoicomonas sp. Mp262 TaxID=2919499 RepID=UPI0021DA3560
MKTILITGFEAFGGESINPALEAVELLEGEVLDNGYQICTAVVPVVKGKSIQVVTEAIDEFQPEAVILVGQAAGRAAMTPERVAINLDDFRIPDNEGYQMIDEPVVTGAPAAYFSDLPIKAMVVAMREAGVPAAVSNTAGTFVCNHLFYGILHHLRNSKTRAGFMHIPLLPSQVTMGNQPSMDLATVVKGLRVAANTVVDIQEDLKLTEGLVC